MGHRPRDPRPPRAAPDRDEGDARLSAGAPPPAVPPEAAAWIGRVRTLRDAVTPRLVESFRAMLDGFLAPAGVPLGLHWCLAPEIVAPRDFGRDGHPRPGLAWPALPAPRRMWAGGALELSAPLTPGAAVERRTAVRAITPKRGATGALWFIDLRHDWSADGRPAIAERQDVVYRPDPAPGAPLPPPPPASEPWDDPDALRLTPDPVLLFRYSALSFNGHRIHYDLAYATGTEGYAGLVVHGPLQATLLLNRAALALGRAPARFAYRGRAPLIAGQAVAVEARPAGGGCELRVRRLADGVATMTATAA